MPRPDSAECPALSECGQVLRDSLGFAPESGEAFDALRERLVRFLLVSELAGDIPTGVPAALATVPRAPAEEMDVVAEIGRRLLAATLPAHRRAGVLGSFGGASP